jgi:hypothetical protein
MGTPTKKGEYLTQTAKSYIESIIDGDLYAFDNIISSKEMEKGITCEDDSIKLINDIKFTDYKKNTVRLSNAWITGECDIHDHEEKVIKDIKTAWNKKTFPKTKQQAFTKSKKAGYPLQGVGYMWLYDCDYFDICYTLVDTPEHLIGYEDWSLHFMDDVPLEMRLTEIRYERDQKKEEKVKEKVEQCREYAEFYKMQIQNRM